MDLVQNKIRWKRNIALGRYRSAGLVYYEPSRTGHCWMRDKDKLGKFLGLKPALWIGNRTEHPRGLKYGY